MKLSIVVPVYNEKDTLEEIVHRVQATLYDKEIIAVDDASEDGSRDILERLAQQHENLRVFYHDKNQGKGAALRTGFAQVTGDVVIIQDADLEYDPIDYPALLEPIEKGLADVVYGSRLIGAQPHRVLYFWHYMGNRCVTFLSNMFTNLNLSDMEVGFGRSAPGYQHKMQPLRGGTGAHRQGGPAKMHRLRGAHQLPRPGLCPRQKNHLAGRHRGHLPHHALPVF